MKKITGRQLPHDVLEHYRFRAIELWREGKKVKDIAHFFGLHRVTVSYWISTYKRGGKRALKSSKAPGPEPKLTPAERKLVLMGLKKPATEYGFEDPLWTCKRVGWLIKEITGKALHISNVWRWLVSCGMSLQKPERRAHEFDPKEWRRWLKEVWSEILENAKKWQAVVYFHDECGVSLTAVLGRTWSPKGKRPTVKVTGKRGKLCVSSAISKGGRLLFRIERDNINSKVFTGFLRQLIRRHPPYRKIIVVTDRAKPHRGKTVDEFAKKNERKLAIYYLPPYSSHHNPDENAWSYLKKNKLKAHQARSLEELKKITLSAMMSIQRRPHLVVSFFHNSFVK